ncbi:MAG: HD domain-containing protein [Cyanobacteriota bacterium]
MNLNYNEKVKLAVFSDEINLRLIEFSKEFKGVDIYLVGGYLRDIVLDIPTEDRDYVITGMSGLLFAEKVAKFFNGHYVLLDKENGIARVVLPDKKDYIDIAPCIGKDIYEDLSRRDFTINAMAYKLNCNPDFQIIDPHNALELIKDKIIKAISEKNIKDDPLRILRAFRIAAQLSGNIDHSTIDFFKQNYKLIVNSAEERVNSELNKLFSLNNSFDYFKMLVDTGILEVIIPELHELHKVPGRGYHHLGLFEHTLEVYKQIELLIKNLSERTVNHLNEFLTHSTRRIVALKYAALLHDISKPGTWVITDDGKHTFIGHPVEGAVLSEQILKRLKLPNTLIKATCKLVRYHLYPSQLSGETNLPTAKAMRRLFRKGGNEVPELIILAIADRKSALGPLITIEDVNNQVEMLIGILDEYYNYLDIEDELPLLLNGRDIMHLLSIKPSPKVGIILNALREYQIECGITNRETAVEWLLKNYGK